MFFFCANTCFTNYDRPNLRKTWRRAHSGGRAPCRITGLGARMCQVPFTDWNKNNIRITRNYTCIYIHITFCLKKTWILAELFSVIHSNPMFVWSVSPRKSRQKQKEAVASPQLRCPTYWWRHTLWPQRYLDHGQAQLSQIRVPCIRTWGYHKKDQET